MYRIVLSMYRLFDVTNVLHIYILSLYRTHWCCLCIEYFDSAYVSHTVMLPLYVLLNQSRVLAGIMAPWLLNCLNWIFIGQRLSDGFYTIQIFVSCLMFTILTFRYIPRHAAKKNFTRVSRIAVFLRGKLTAPSTRRFYHSWK